MSANEESAEALISDSVDGKVFGLHCSTGLSLPTSFYGNGEPKFPSLPRFYINLSLLCVERPRPVAS